MSNTASASGLKGQYFELIQWLVEHPNLSYWVSLLISAFVILTMMYLIITNLRLHRHIRGLNRDKQRLMEEKDLMRRGAQSQTDQQSKTDERSKHDSSEKLIHHHDDAQDGAMEV
jgi:hypothetical protein